MTKSNTASGPGNPRKEQQDAIAQEEGLEELQPETETDTEDPAVQARHAGRNAGVGSGDDAEKDTGR